jgi:hypothetical protein
MACKFYLEEEILKLQKWRTDSLWPEVRAGGMVAGGKQTVWLERANWGGCGGVESFCPLPVSALVRWL